MTKGTKLDQEKPDYTLLPTEFVTLCAPAERPTGFVEHVFHLTEEDAITHGERELEDLIDQLVYDTNMAGDFSPHSPGRARQRVFDVVVRVLEYGVTKYGRGNWMHVPDAEQRYRAAARRHAVAMVCGGAAAVDDESGLPHWGHALACIAFLLWFDRRPEGCDDDA